MIFCGSCTLAGKLISLLHFTETLSWINGSVQHAQREQYGDQRKLGLVKESGIITPSMQGKNSVDDILK